MRLRPLALAWLIGLLGVLGQLLLGACAPHPSEPEEDAPAPTVPAGALGERSDQVRSPLALTATDGTQLRLLSVQAKAAIDQPLAFTELHLVFENDEDRTIEGRFRIELPSHAAISRFAMKIGDDWQEGEVVERQAARGAFEDFLHRRRDPALLEHEAGNSFSARVFPIPARATKEIIVSYSQELTSSSAPYRLALRGLPELAKFSARVIRRDGAGSLVTTDVEEAHWTPAADLEVHPSPGAPRAIALRHARLAVARWTPPGEDVAAPIDAVTLLFDTSASRAIGFDTRIHRLGDLVRALVHRQGRDFELRVIAFDQTMAPIYHGSASGFGRDALESIAAGRALGASDLVGALQRVREASMQADRIVVVTDGVLTAGGTEIADLAQAASDLAAGGVARIDAVVDGGSIGDAGMRALTTSSTASTGVVIDAELPVETIADKLSRTTLPALSVTVPGATWVWPAKLEGVQAGDEVIVYADLPAELPMRLFAGHHDPITPVDVVAERPLLERAWVRAKIERLQARRSAMDANDKERRQAIEREIVALSTKFRVLSDFTALLVFESEGDYIRLGLARRALTDILVVGDQGVTLLERTHLAPFPDIEPRSGYTARLPIQSDDEDVWGSLTGPEIGEGCCAGGLGLGGLGLVGTGRGAGGEGDGSVGLGSVGFIGHRADAAAHGSRGRRPLVRQGKAQVKGSLDKELVRRIVRAHINEIRYCYNQGLVRDPKLRGKVVVQFTIDAFGRVPAAVVHNSTLRHPLVEQCAAKAVRRWKFPKPTGGTVLVTYPFILESDGLGRFVPATPPVESRPPMPPTPPPPAIEEREADGGPFTTVMTALAEGRTSDALATTLAWRETDAGDVMAVIALGEVAEALGDRATAARAYGSIIDLHPARADLRRYAGALLARLGPVGNELSLDTYTKALSSRPDHPSSYRGVAFALVAAGRYGDAFTTLDEALSGDRIRWERFEGVQRLLREDLAIVGAAWLAKEPHTRGEIDAVLDRHHVVVAKAPSTRFVLTWETDANDVDFHVRDAHGDHAYYSNKRLASGGELFADITSGYGPECFAIEGTPTTGPYQLSANYFARGPMGFGMGSVQVLEHDGRGGLHIEVRPFVITTSGGTVDLGSYTPR